MTSNSECCIAAVGTALPPNRYGTEDIRAVGHDWLQAYPDKLGIFEKFLRSCNVSQRFFAIPAPDILRLNGLHGRTAFFEREGPDLGSRAMLEALDLCDLNAADIGSYLFTSCSCPSIPAIDALILERVGLPRTVKRLPIYQHGCAAGVVGLSLAWQLAQLGQAVVLNSVELCSLVFNSAEPSAAELVGSAIFADGAACAVVIPGNRGLSFRASRSYLIPNSRHIMGYNILDDGFHLRLDRELPAILTEFALQQVPEFLAAAGVKVKEVKYWLFHPGGAKILNLFEHTLDLSSNQAVWSREVLDQCGNLSSATILFVIKKFLDSGAASDGDYVMALGVGPGLTLELILFRYISP